MKKLWVLVIGRTRSKSNVGLIFFSFWKAKSFRSRRSACFARKRMSIGLFRTVELLRRLCRSSDFKQRWTFSQCVQEVLSSFHNDSMNQNNFHICKQQKASQFYRLVHNYEGSKIYTGRASSKTSQLYIPDTKKGIKYPSQQALEGLRPFGWKVSGLRPGSSCQDIRTGTLSNQVAWRILQTKAGSFLTVKVRTMIEVV